MFKWENFGVRLGRMAITGWNMVHWNSRYKPGLPQVNQMPQSEYNLAYFGHQSHTVGTKRMGNYSFIGRIHSKWLDFIRVKTHGHILVVLQEDSQTHPTCLWPPWDSGSKDATHQRINQLSWPINLKPVNQIKPPFFKK